MEQRYAIPVLLTLFALGSASRSAAQGDTCTTALEVVSGVYACTGPTTGYAGPGCGSGTNGKWYRYTASFNGAITITSCHPLNNGLQYDTYLKVYRGTCDGLICVGNNDDMGQAGQGCPNNPFASYMQVNVTAGETYYIVWTNTFSSLAFTWELNECAGTATGSTYRDSNSNGVRDAGEAHVPAMLLVQPGDHHVYAGGDPYAFCTDLGTHTVTVPTPPLYHAVVPDSREFTIATMGTQVVGVDFAFQPIPGYYDGSCDIWGWNPWIGNNTQLHLSYANIGTETIHATLMLNLDALLEFASASVDPDQVSGQEISWDLGALAPGATGIIHVTIHTPATVQPNAAVSNGVVLITEEDDVNLYNNADHVDGHATTSFDPNDKQVNLESLTPQDIADRKPLEYTIRFQNTGNAPAVNIVIKDSLDGDWDLSTFAMIGATHPYTLTVNDQVAIWTFANIMLPTEDSDAAGSQGSLHYRMTPKNSLVLGDQLTNRADIYFDYNAPVLTNTTVTTVELTTGLGNSSRRGGLTVSPSPSNGLVTLRWSSSPYANERLSILDAMGRVVHSTSLGATNGQRTLDLSFLPQGAYVARISGSSEALARFVIQR